MLLDDLGGARSAVEHLIAHGHTRIACVGDDAGLYTMRERITGYREALAAAGDRARPVAARPPAPATSRPPRGRRPRLLALPAERRPTALFTANNRNTIGALHALARRARRRPRWSASTTSSSPTCSAPPSSAPTRGSSASRAPRSRSPGSTATSGRRARVTIPTELVARGSGERAMKPLRPPAQPVPPLLQGRRAHRRAARRARGRGRPARGLGRLDRHLVGLRDRGPEPARGRHGPQGRDRRRPRGVPRPRARRALRRRPGAAGQAPRRRRAPARPLPPRPRLRQASTSASATARPRRG